MERPMTLEQLYTTLNAIFLEQPNIRTVYNTDIYQINNDPKAEYCVGGITENRHREDESFFYWNVNLFYIDRLTESKDNTIMIESQGISVLRNVIRNFNEAVGCQVEGQIEYVPFIQRFNDECAGVYAVVTFVLPLDSLCDEDYNINFDGT